MNAPQTRSLIAAGLVVRDAVAADLTAAHTIYQHYVLHGRASFEEIPPTLDEMRNRHAHVLRQRLPYLVAEYDGQIVGYAYASAYRTRSAYRFTVEDSVYVAEGQQGRGVGRALLAELIVRCEAGPWRQMIAVIASSASGEGAGSLVLHERMGFRNVGVLHDVGFKHGQWLDTVFLQRELGAGSETPPVDA
ncbi:GNAT family N-acetyltransferase [Andreprevotia chitinilytica]|uniref:GNAT family N-acetyltransferase n=1 Tax=Andreprevotia chitinilytica TaxID=396808 RepID=UPI000AC23573|nr:GNAT family N-acetyltransferase [Andreprevotia chitinilytica]